MSEMGTALPGYTAEDLLRIMDVNHLRITKDAAMVARRGPTFPAEENERAAHMVMLPQTRALMNTDDTNPTIVAVDGHFDPSQHGKISPVSYICSMLSQAMRQQTQEHIASPGAGHSEMASSRKVVLEYYCSLHTVDDLRGPQGLMRCLVTQLILSLVANGWMGQEDAVHLPYLRDVEEDLLKERCLDAVCRLFMALTRHVPRGVPVYCFVDSWSAYEREDLRADYQVVMDTLLEATDASSLDNGANVKLLLTSPTKSRWLIGVLPPERKVALRNREGGGAQWRGAGRGNLLSMARAATSPHANGGFGGGFSVDEHGQDGMGEAYDQGSSTKVRW